MRKMEAKGRKMLALGVVAMMCAVAIIGIGYATAFGGTANTYNENNTATAKSLKLDNAAWTAMVDVTAVEFDEYTYQTGHAYYKTGATAVNTTYKGILLTTNTKDLTLTNNTGAAIAGISFTAFTGSSIGTTDFVYILEVSVGTAAEFSSEEEQTAYIVFNGTAAPAAADIELTSEINNNGSVLIKMNLYLAYLPDVEVPASMIGPATAYNPASPTVGATPAKASETGPAGATISSIGFGFSVTEYVPTP